MGRTITDDSLLLCILLNFLPLPHGCPAPCRCTGARVLCPPGQTSFPSGLHPSTKALILSGRPSPQGGNNIPSLRHSDLNSLPELEDLTMTFAHLEDLQEDALSSLGKLKRLNLHDNQVRILTSKSLAGLDKLGFLDLTNNEGCTLQGDVFGRLTSLMTLYMGGMRLGEVKSEWFQALSSLESLDLHSNRIQALEPDFLQGLANMKMLDLTDNQLQTLPPPLRTTFTSLSSLYLGNNPWHCNCQLRWFKQLRSPRHSSDIAVCITPQPLAFREVAEVPDGEMTCLPPKILRCDGPYDVNAGTNVILECDVEGDPFPEVTWAAPGGKVTDVSPPGRFSSPRKTVNSSLVTVVDFHLHHGQWTVSATSLQGSDTAQLTVNVLTTTTTTTATTTTKTKPQPTTDEPVSTDTTSTLTPSVWFYMALVAFGFSALSLIALILVAAFKLRKNQRQVAQGRHDSRLSLGSTAETDLRRFSPGPSTGFRGHAV